MITDEACALNIQHGDPQALKMLVERHHSPLIGFLYRMTNGNRTLAEDMAQESFLKVLHSIAGYEYPRSFKAWLYAIATNLVRDHYKRADTRYAVWVGDETLDRLHDHYEDEPENNALLSDEIQQVIKALGCLPDHQREVVVLRYYQEFSLNEIADALDLPVGTVKSRLSLGLRRLRELLEVK